MYKKVVQVWRQVQDCHSFYQALRCCPVVGPWSRTYPPSLCLLSQVTFNLLHILLHPSRRLLTDSTQELLRLQKTSVPNVVSIANQRAEKHAHDQVGSTTGGPWAATSTWIQKHDTIQCLYDVFYSHFSQQHVSASFSAIFRVISSQEYECTNMARCVIVT